MKKISQLNEKGLLKREKACLLAQITGLITNIAGLGLIMLSAGMGVSQSFTNTEVFTVLGTGVGLGIAGCLGTSHALKTNEKLQLEKIRRKEFEGFPLVEDEKAAE